MRVLQVVHFYLPRHTAGTEIYTYHLGQALRRRHEVALFCSEKLHARPSYSLVRRDHEGVACHVVVNNLLYESYRETYRNPAVEARFAEVLEEVRPDVVHIQHLMLLSLGLARIARERGIPVVMTLHDFWLACPRHGQLLEDGVRLCEGPEETRCSRCLGSLPWRQSPAAARTLRTLAGVRRATGLDLSRAVEWAARRRRGRRTASGDAGGTPPADAVAPELLAERRGDVAALVAAVDRFVVPSRTVGDRMQEWGVPGDRLQLIRNAIPAPAASAAPREDGELRIGYLGTVAPHKGLKVLVDAFRRAALAGAHLRVVGGAGYYPDYWRQVKESAEGVAVQFTGAVPNAEVGRELAGMDLLVVPSLWLENAPVVIEEARHLRIPVVASNLGGMAEAIRDGVDGRLFEAGDAAALAQLLQELAGDRAQLQRYRDAAPAPVDQDQHVAALEQLYQQVREERAS